jgi:hypothetical protein
VDPVPDPPLLRKSDSAGNRSWDLWTCNHELWPLEHRGGLQCVHKTNYNLWLLKWLYRCWKIWWEMELKDFFCAHILMCSWGIQCLSYRPVNLFQFALLQLIWFQQHRSRIYEHPVQERMRSDYSYELILHHKHFLNRYSIRVVFCFPAINNCQA